ncbi:MAG: hypothetical protein Tp1124SUR1240571_3 [Prokaryotic dsDNA virus sp.]|nr:MAG: hypothetical protein Tp1124SUR1240571_3 [Prokaryotic dsDNA virus sp.]|tara:strand:+ start:805 stop:2373 length:1569 start_codon:yes stop_codon:yes gene_type:complete
MTKARDLANFVHGIDASKITSGTFADARIAASNVNQHATDYDDNKIQANLAILAFKSATNGSLAAYNLVDQVIDEYTDATGIDASASTNEILKSGSFRGGGTPTLGSSVTKEFASSNASFDITEGSIIDKMFVIGGGGAGGNRAAAGTDSACGGGGGGGWIGAVNFTVPAGINSAVVTVGAGGGSGGSNSTGQTGGSSSIQFGSALTLTATGGSGGGVSPSGSGTGSGGSGGSSSKTGTSAGGLTSLSLSGGSGGNGQGQGTGGGGSSGSSGTLSGVSYQAAGGGGGGSGNGSGATGGSGSSASFSGGGGGGGGDSETENSGKAGGSGYTSGGEGSSTDGNEDGGSATVDGVNVDGGDGAKNPQARPKNVGGGGGLFGGGGGGIGDGIGNSNVGNGGQGYVRLEYRPMNTPIDNLTLKSTNTTAQSTPTKADMVMLLENAVGTATLNTDVKGFISRDGGTTFTQGTLVDEGTWGTNKKILAFHDLDISAQPSGTSLCYKISTHNQSVGSKETNIHATSIGWK